jgi:hypothetical protein
LTQGTRLTSAGGARSRPWEEIRPRGRPGDLHEEEAGHAWRALVRGSRVKAYTEAVTLAATRRGLLVADRLTDAT